MFTLKRKKTEMVTKADALPGRPNPIPTADTHFINVRDLKAPVPDGMEEAIFGMGCFWGVERKFWQTDGVWLSMAGYAAGITPNPTYEEVCTGLTGHNEVVRVIYDPSVVSYDELLQLFWEGHDPTQGMRQVREALEIEINVQLAKLAMIEENDVPRLNAMAIKLALPALDHKKTIDD